MSRKTFDQITNQTLKGAALQQLAQNSAGSDEFGEIVFGGNVAFTASVLAFNGTGTTVANSEILTIVTATQGTLADGATITTGTGIPAGATVVNQLLPLQPGEALGGIGRYQLSAPATTTEATAEAIVATSNVLTVTAVASGFIGDGNVFTGTSVPANSKIVQQLTSTNADGSLGGPGTYLISTFAAIASEAMAIASASAVVDGDNFAIFTGEWTGRQEYESNTDVTVYNGRKYWLKLLAASALTLGDASLNNTDTGVIKDVTINNHGMSQGYVFSVGTENFYVVGVDDVNHVDVLRGYCGSAVAAHAQGATINTLANYTGIALLADFVIPITALAIATAGPQIAAAMTFLDGFNPKYNGSLATGVQEYLSARKLYLDWEYIAANNRLFFHRPARAVTSNTLVQIAYAITNAYGSQTLTQGVQIGEVMRSAAVRVPTIEEVAAGYMDFPFPYPIAGWGVKGFTTTTLASVTIGSTITFSADFRRLTLTNNGTNNFTTAETLMVDVVFQPGSGPN